jgi:putative endonuclease
VDRVQRGRAGEEEAIRYLRSRGWVILGRNVRAGRAEVDVIAMRGRVLAFVEVKCRRDLGFGHPLEAITASKQKKVARVARHWLRDRPLPPGTTLRFDAVAVQWPEGGPPTVVHVPDAWRLG